MIILFTLNPLTQWDRDLSTKKTGYQNTRRVTLYSVLGEMHKNESTLEDKLWDWLTNFPHTGEAILDE